MKEHAGTTYLLPFVLCMSVISCIGLDSHECDQLISVLETAENDRNPAAIEDLFSDDAILYTTEIMPISGKAAIRDLYEFVFSQRAARHVSYHIDSTVLDAEKCVQYGTVTTRSANEAENSEPFSVVVLKSDEHFKILEISYGNPVELLKTLPEMLKPTGPFDIGWQTFYYDRKDSGNGRRISMQAWYPAEAGSSEKEPFRSPAVQRHASAFLGFPDFATSYFSRIKSHTNKKARPFRDQLFPVIIYNHGYGGYSQVYQSVFEDLASHGYVVVSIGHENESALLIKDDGTVIANSPDNPFYTKRAPELNGRKVGRWQSVILNSNSIEENDAAYTKMLELTPLHNESTDLWASDTKAAIEKLRMINNDHGESLMGAMDLNAVGIFGHSLGGATAGQLCGESSVFKAGINLDGFQFGNLHSDQLNVPFMFVASNPQGNTYLRSLTFIDRSEADCYQVTLKGFEHDNFTDLKFITEGDANAMELQRELIRAFFDRYVKGNNTNLSSLQDEFDRIEFTRIKSR